MTVSDADRAHLNEVMDRARRKCGKQWKQVARDGGLSYETLRAARKGPGDISDETKRGIELGLEWEPGSVDAVLARKPPTPRRSVRGDRVLPSVLDMSPRELAEWAIEIGDLVADVAGRDAGDAASERFLAAAIRRRARAASEDSDPDDHLTVEKADRDAG